MKEYCELRIKLYELLSKEIKQENGDYSKEIKDYNDQIKAIYGRSKPKK